MTDTNEELINHRLGVLESDVKDLSANIYELTTSVKLLASGMVQVKWVGLAAAGSVITHMVKAIVTVS